MLAPHATTSSAWSTVSMSVAAHPAGYVRPHAHAPAEKQIVPSIFAAPRRLNSRRSIEEPCSSPMVPR